MHSICNPTSGFLAITIGSFVILSSAHAQDGDLGGNQLSGAPAVASSADFNADVDPVQNFIDGEPELNPVSADELMRLMELYPPDASVFKKYAFLPSLFAVPAPPGVDHLAAGAGTRNAGFGTIMLRGILPGSTPVSAFLYWAQIINTPVFPAIQTVRLNGVAVTGFAIAASPSPCWGGTQIVAYRAPVLPFLLPGINGDYSVTRLPTGKTNGEDPWNPISPVFPLSEGTSLVVLFTHPSIPSGTFTQIHHPMTSIPVSAGVGATFGILNFTHFLNLPIRTVAMKHTRLGADGQVFQGLNNRVATTTETTFISGPIPQPFVQIRGVGPYFNGSQDSDWNGQDGEPLNQLWDTHTMNIPNSIAAGLLTTNYRVRYVANADCIMPVAHVITAR